MTPKLSTFLRIVLWNMDNAAEAYRIRYAKYGSWLPIMVHTDYMDQILRKLVWSRTIDPTGECVKPID